MFCGTLESVLRNSLFQAAAVAMLLLPYYRRRLLRLCWRRKRKSHPSPLPPPLNSSSSSSRSSSGLSKTFSVSVRTPRQLAASACIKRRNCYQRIVSSDINVAKPTLLSQVIVILVILQQLSVCQKSIRRRINGNHLETKVQNI
jgi:hypothetical protein